MKLKNIFLISLIAMPLTFLEVSAAGNTNRLKDTIIDKSIQKFEDGFNSFFTNTELTIEGRTAADPNFTLLTINPVSKNEAEGNLTFFQGSIIRQNNRDTINVGIGYRHLVMIRTGYMELIHFMIMKILMDTQDGVLVLN